MNYMIDRHLDHGNDFADENHPMSIPALTKEVKMGYLIQRRSAGSLWRTCIYLGLKKHIYFKVRSYLLLSVTTVDGNFYKDQFLGRMDW